MHLKSITSCTGVAKKLRFGENPCSFPQTIYGSRCGLVGSGAKPQPLTILVHVHVYVYKKEAFSAIKIFMLCLVW